MSLRVAYLITRSDAIGGAQVHVLDLAREMLARGHDVSVWAGGAGPFLEELRAAGIPFRRIGHLVRPIHPVRDACALGEICRELVRARPQLLSTHASKAGWLGRLAGRLTRVPTLHTAHGWPFGPATPAPLYAWAERAASLVAVPMLAVSEDVRRVALRHRLVRPSRISTVRVSVPEVGDELRANPGLQPPRLISVARFELPKDPLTLIRALGELRDLAWCADLVGDGPLCGPARAEAERLGLAGRVRFLGPRRDVAHLLPGAQLFCLASRREGLPLTILEAMRAGLPVVASDVGGVREAVEDGITGRLVRARDPAALSRALRTLLADPGLRVRMGGAGRSRYERDLAFGPMVERTLRAYDAVVHGGRPG